MATSTCDSDATALGICEVDCDCVAAALAELEDAQLGDEDPEAADARDDPVSDGELVGDHVAIAEGDWDNIGVWAALLEPDVLVCCDVG